jgi:hypothetical protein
MSSPDRQLVKLAALVNRGRRAVAELDGAGDIVVSFHNQPVGTILDLIEQDPDEWVLERMCMQDKPDKHWLCALTHPTGSFLTRITIFSEHVDDPEKLPENRGTRP